MNPPALLPPRRRHVALASLFLRLGVLIASGTILTLLAAAETGLWWGAEAWPGRGTEMLGLGLLAWLLGVTWYGYGRWGGFASPNDDAPLAEDDLRALIQYLGALGAEHLSRTIATRAPTLTYTQAPIVLLTAEVYVRSMIGRPEPKTGGTLDAPQEEL